MSLCVINGAFTQSQFYLKNVNVLKMSRYNVNVDEGMDSMKWT